MKRIIVLGLVAWFALLVPVRSQTRIAAQPTAGTARASHMVSGTREDPDLFHHLPVHIGRDLVGLSRSSQGLVLIGAGVAASLALRETDEQVGHHTPTAHDALRVGNFLGSTEGAYGLGFALYGLGWATQSPRAQRGGMIAIESLVLADGLAGGVKLAVNRARPHGGRFSFPSGHTANAFTMASVLDSAFGHRYGIPAYLLASAVAYSRVASGKHYVSDVVFGAAIGTAVGRTVTLLHSKRVTIRPAVGKSAKGVQIGVSF